MGRPQLDNLARVGAKPAAQNELQSLTRCVTRSLDDAALAFYRYQSDSRYPSSALAAE